MTIFDILKSGNIDVHISAHLLVVCVISWIIVSLFSLSISHCYVLFSFLSFYQSLLCSVLFSLFLLVIVMFCSLLRLLITPWVTSNCLQLSDIVYRALVSATSGTGTECTSRAPEFTPGFQWGSCYSIVTFICMFCRSLFVLLCFFF